jgi:anti-sigma B factor antagonist
MTERASSEQAGPQELFELAELSMTTGRTGPVQTITLTGELDLASADAVHGELIRAEATDAQTILLDLTGLSFLDSSGIRLLIAAAGRSQADSRRLVIRRPPENVRRVLRVAGVDDRLPFSD